MKTIFKCVLVLCCLQSIAAQTIQERIHEIQSFEDFKRIAAEQQEAAKVFIKARIEEGERERDQQSISSYTHFSGKDNPELVSIINLIGMAIRGDVYEYLASDLLKRGFPEEDLPILKALMSYSKEEHHEDYMKYYLRYKKELLADTVFADQDLLKVNWKAYRSALDDPSQREKARAEIRRFMHARDLASAKALDQIILDLLQPFSAQALRVIVSFCYEERVQGTTVAYKSDVITEGDIDLFIERLVYDVK